ncbi:hypothetical protein E5427_24025 [Escherichia coli]|nr:hypothetical protein [Salmonella enterica subsp. enterica serovar Johannesburg]ECR4857127.1 hypothetical protein [Salmonella enterica]EFB7616304.1 hypothetical protein [Escherichia coli]EFC4005393.1 hypothetical protein [Escherichia coli]MIK23510.1 hypothetical protein [Salmonella enterica subsp. enterica serovar Johannesburg]
MFFSRETAGRFSASDNCLAYFRTFPCVVVPPFWRFPKAIWLKNGLNVVYFPNSRRPPYLAIFPRMPQA